MHTSLNISHEKVLAYLRQGEIFYKWMLGCQKSQLKFSVLPHGEVFETQFKLEALSIFPKKINLDILISGKELQKEEFTYFKSVGNKEQISLFGAIQTLFFENENITFMDAKFIIKPNKGLLSSFLANKLALNLGKSV